MSLFKGRSNVYARRWENKAGKTGYSPYCLNEWKKSICQKPRVKCSECSQLKYDPINEAVIEKHLRGEIIIGLYPICDDETCYFLLILMEQTGKKTLQQSEMFVTSISFRLQLNDLVLVMARTFGYSLILPYQQV